VGIQPGPRVDALEEEDRRNYESGDDCRDDAETNPGGGRYIAGEPNRESDEQSQVEHCHTDHEQP
jgi:hypothetical protein